MAKGRVGPCEGQPAASFECAVCCCVLDGVLARLARFRHARRPATRETKDSNLIYNNHDEKTPAQ